jgi:glyoxylase-like metal-dependent hydrolase (beta-lactamase superfamily II)
VLEVGRLRIGTIATPGHTPGSMCFTIEGTPLLFSGDTLFPGGPGNTSFEHSDFGTIIESIDTRLFGALDPGTLVFPGHGAATTIGTESPHLDEWIERGW